MQLYHHDQRDYETAKGQMANNVRAKFEASIKTGMAECQKVLEQIDNEVPEDSIVPTGAIEFVPTGNGVELAIARNGTRRIHDNALHQFCFRAKMNLKYVRQLQDMAADEKNGAAQWAHELIAHNLTTLYKRGPGANKRYLMRAVDGQVRGWLSDRYRRLDCRPLLAAFYESAIKKAGAVPIRGYGLPTKVAIRVIMPRVFEPIPNQPMLYGLEWYNSDFGHGTHSMRAFIHQPWCTNEATRDDILRETHIGARLSEDMEFSEKTRKLDQDISASAIADMVAGLLKPAAVDEAMAVITKAYRDKVDAKSIPTMLKQLRQGEVKKVVEVFNSADIENLSPGQNRWRLSNAISFVATQTENKYRALELERMSGRVAGLATKTKVEE